MKGDKTQFDKPLEQPKASQGIEARIFSMPERYRHLAEGKMTEPAQKQARSPVAQIKAPEVALLAPKAPPKFVVSQPKPKKKKLTTTKMIMISGGIAVLLLGVGGYALVSLTQQEIQKPSGTQTTTTPATQTQTQIPEQEIESEEIETETESEPFPTAVTSGIDSDSDGLTDSEENLVYRTNPRLPDTDLDGFLDGNEVFHRYNPSGTAPGTLFEAGLVKLQTGAVEGVSYEFYYPSVWDLEVDGNGYAIDALTGEGIKISFVKKSESQALLDWSVTIAADEEYLKGKTKNLLDLIQTQDQLKAYLDLGSVVMVFDYDTGTKGRVEYLQSLQMMINSVKSVKSEVLNNESGLAQ